MNILRALVTLLILLASSAVRADQVFSQPPNPAGGQFKSSWYAPDGLDGDEYAFDSFMLSADAAINEIHWRGAYTNYLSGAGKAPVYAFTISIYRSIAGGSQPDLGTGGRLARYNITGNAGETAVGTFGGVIMYDYTYTIASPFQATAGSNYWIQMEASQGVTPNYYWPPDWSIAAATGGNNAHFRRVTGGTYQAISGDLAFSLYSSNAASVTISASVEPAGTGSITGAGSYPINSTVSLLATPNAGFGFVNWTQNGTQVSTNPRYNFTATVNRTLVANFVQSCTITTASAPSYGGTTTGGGAANIGSTVTLVATPNHGFEFLGWSDGCPTPTNTFTADGDLWLTAFFGSAPGSATFDFNDAPAYTTLPIDLSSGGLQAHFSAYAVSGGTFAIWPYDTWGIRPAGFEGLSLFPTSVFGADLIADFSQPIVDFSILYALQELGCDDTATMRATAYMNGAYVGTATAQVPVPGTYPSGTLSIALATPFNRVVVHYDSRPPTCQDWGPIFFADIVTVTRAALCPADFDGDGTVDFFDYDAFVNCFEGLSCPQDKTADFDADGAIDFFDYDAFVVAFEAGC